MRSKEKFSASQLAKVYYDPSQPEGFAGASRLEKKFPKINVKKWLATQPAYSLHKPLRRKFPTRKYATSGPDELWQMDLMEMIPYASINSKYRYILTCIDVFSRFVRAIPVKNKDAKTLAEVLKKLFAHDKLAPRHVQTDLGKEFYNKSVQALFRSLKINHYTVHSQFKAAVVERFNRTLRERLNRLFTHQRNKKWVDVLPKIIDAYNHSSHRSLGGKRPIDLYNKKMNNMEDWEQQQPPPGKLKRKHAFHAGALVRISRISTSSPFRKNFDQNWSEEIFRIASVATNTKPIMYILKDATSDEVIDGKFYHEELQDVGDTLPTVYRIEKIISTKGSGVHKQYLVKWYGYDKSRNSWITQDQLVK